MEFASIGLCAYDLALLTETLLFLIMWHKYNKNTEASQQIQLVIHQGISAYETEVGLERARKPAFVRQVCGLIGCEHLWRYMSLLGVMLHYSTHTFNRLFIACSMKIWV